MDSHKIIELESIKKKERKKESREQATRTRTKNKNKIVGFLKMKEKTSMMRPTMPIESKQ